MMMRLLCAALLLALGLEVNAQSRVISKRALAEKIYLQTDGEVYTNDQAIWYKAVVVNAANHRPTQLSGVLYVELIGANALISDRKIIKLKDGIGTGYFQLDESLKPGAYMLRAYTEWNKNFGADFHFTKYIDIYEQTDKAPADPFGKINLIEQNGRYTVEVEINPLLIDSLHSSVLSGSLSFEGGKDTINIKASDNGDYTLQYQLPENTDLLALNFETENGKTFSKTILTNPDALDLRFFPEGGDLVHGLTSKVGFKAVSVRGNGVEVAGDIIDEQGNVITSFKSNPLGMGYFALLPDSSKSYYAQLKSRAQNDLNLQYELPKVKSKGAILSVSERRGNLLLGVTSNTLAGDSVFIRSTSRGVRYYDVQGRISQEGQLQFLLPVKELPEGIIVFTLYSKKGVALAERLYFNQSGQKRLTISVSSDKADYQQRQESKITATVTDKSGNPVNASVSYLVVNMNELGKLQQQRQNLVSQLLLSSELKGEVEKPGYYFQPEKDRAKELDALMLTQGWRRYVFTPNPGISTISGMEFQPEYGMTVSGTVSRLANRKRRAEGVDLTMMTFGQSNELYQYTTDSAGRFYFDVDDAYGEKQKILIQSTNGKGKNKNYSLRLDERPLPAIQYSVRKTIASVDSVVNVIVDKHRERKLIEDAYKPDTDVRDLGEFVVEDYAITRERQKVIKVHGMPDVVIDGDDIRAESKKWSSGLYSAFRFAFPDDIVLLKRYDELGIPYEYASVRGSDITLVTIDGVIVELDDYSLLPFIPIDEVKSFEIMRSPNNFAQLFLKVYRNSNPMPPVPADATIIAIYTNAGKGLYGANKADGIYQGTAQVFSPPREFYKPKYEKLSRQDWVKPDYRALVHWQPQASTDDSGRATVSFYNADHTGEMLVVVEAIAEDGSIGYQEFVYEVVKNTDRD